jgi:acyl phosphate:glycerol-3-phosphate acyltransferase
VFLARRRAAAPAAMTADTLVLDAVAIVAAYLIGSIPWSVVVARVIGGPDPRTVGSGRTGGANVLRAYGPRIALLTGLLDLSKGVVAVLVARFLGLGPLVESLAALAAIVGHSRSVFLGFQGGRGVATGFGALLVISPLVAAVVAPIFAAVVVVSRYSSLGSLLGAALGGVLLAVLVAAGSAAREYLVYAIAGAALIWLFHLDNIQRLIAGTERRIDRRA